MYYNIDMGMQINLGESKMMTTKHQLRKLDGGGNAINI